MTATVSGRTMSARCRTDPSGSPPPVHDLPRSPEVVGATLAFAPARALSPLEVVGATLVVARGASVHSSTG
ncbi:MAG: hypothetical protein KatS3mg077_1631 [Candidatus Binatia bacterium]|nr:MAG: hypothetical protein KatS3mg077_1631 [Candidatus Binatia bacterium]